MSSALKKSARKARSDHTRKDSSDRTRDIRQPLLVQEDPDDSQPVITRQPRTKKANPRFQNIDQQYDGMFTVNDSREEQRIVTHKSRRTGSRVQSRQHLESYYAPPLSETTDGGEPRYYTDQKRVLHHAELKENLNELHLSSQVNNQIQKEVTAAEEGQEFEWDEQELEREVINMNYPAKDVERTINAFKVKIPDLKQKQISQYLENYKNIAGVKRAPDFKVCVHIHGNEINFLHATHHVVVHEDELRLVTLGTVMARTRYDTAGYKLYLLMHRIYFEPRCAISREPIFQTELTSFENDKFIDTRSKLFYQIENHLYFYKVITNMEDDFSQDIKFMKIDFAEEKIVAIEVSDYHFQYKLQDNDEKAKHNLVSHVIFPSNIRYDTRIPQRQKKEADNEYNNEDELKEQLIQIAYDAKVDNINSKLGVAYAFTRIKDKGVPMKIKPNQYFYEIQNQRDSEGEPKHNFSFFGKVKKGSDAFCWVANAQVLKVLKVNSDQIEEIKDKKELQMLESGVKGDYSLIDKVHHSIKYQNQQIVKVLERSPQPIDTHDEKQLEEQQRRREDPKNQAVIKAINKFRQLGRKEEWVQCTFNWHTNKEYFYKHAQHPDVELDQDDEYMQYFEEEEEDIGMKKTEGKKGLPLKLSAMNAIFLIELFDQSQFCIISKLHNPDGDEFIQIRKYEEIDQDIYINERNIKIQGHPFVKLLTLDREMNLNQVRSSCGNVFVRLKDKQIVQANHDYTELTALGHVTHQDEATDIPHSLQRFRENNQMIKPIAQTHNIPFLLVKEDILVDQMEEDGCITKKKRVLQRPCITFLDKHMQLLTHEVDGKTVDVEEMVNIYNIDYGSAKQLKRMKCSLSSHVYVYNGAYTQNFQIINKMNNDGLCWFVIQEFMYNVEGTPNPRLIGLKVLLTDIEKYGHMYFSPMYEGDTVENFNSYICGTQVFYKKHKGRVVSSSHNGVDRDEDNHGDLFKDEISIKMKNLEADEYQIRNEISSNSYKSYILDQEHLDRSEDKTKYLIVEARISETLRENISMSLSEDKDNIQFTQNEVFSILWNQVTTTLNMYPLQGLDSQLFGDLKKKQEFDIFQPLELLRGKSLSSIMVQDANWFSQELERIRKAQKKDACPSLVDDYTQDKPEMRAHMEQLDLIRQPYDIVKDLQDESILITCLTNEETSQTFKLLIDYMFDRQRRTQGGYTILMQLMTYIMNREDDDMEYPCSYMRFFNDGEQYNIAVKIDNLEGIMPEYIGAHEHMIKYRPNHPSLYLRYIGDDKRTTDELCHAVKHRLRGQVPKEAVDHTIVDFGLLETHAKLKKLKNKSETAITKLSSGVLKQFDIDQNVLGDSFDQFHAKVRHEVMKEIGLKAERKSGRDFPINDFERDFPSIDRYAIAQIVWKFNCFYGDQIENQQSMKAIIRHMYLATKKQQLIQGIIFALLFVVPFLYQLNTLDYEKPTHNEGTRICMWFCMAYQIMIAIKSLVLLKAGGWMFFFNKHNNADLLMITLYTVYFTLANELEKNMVIPYHKTMTGEDSWISILLVAILFLMLYKLAKFAEIYRRFSILTRMFVRCVYDVAPFTIFLITWNFFFSIAFRLLGVEIGDAVFPNLRPFFRYFTLAFDNSMGAISTPILSGHDYVQGYSWGMIHLVWFIWFANQFVVTIILMNLLIAVLGDAFANITSNQSQIRYNEEATMNKDYYHLVHAGTNSSYVYQLFDGKREQHHPISLLSYKIEPKSMTEWQGMSSKIIGEIRVKFDSLLKHVLKIKREQQDQNEKQEKNNDAFKKEVLAMLQAIKDKQEEQDQVLELARGAVSRSQTQSQGNFDFERSGTLVANTDAIIEDEL